MDDKNTQFNIPKDGYLTFDALTIRQFIKDRLNESNMFTDQNYEGSNITMLNEIISYVFHALLFYLNKTSSESMFSESQIYENMNRIVKLIEYNPTGKQTATTTFGLSASENISEGIYTIPRYSYVTLGNINYSINDDITISKTISGIESLDDIASQKLLYNGKYVEYPLYPAIGTPNEIVVLSPGVNVGIDHFNISVYVYENNTNVSGWYEWKRVPSLYLENGSDRSYEIRYNENKQYEIKFGNNINGKGLSLGDKVIVYYLNIQETEGEISANDINNVPLKNFSSEIFNTILNDINNRAGNNSNYLDAVQLNNLRVTNTNDSTYFQTEESVESIRQNAPGVFKSQYRVVTFDDYKNYIQTNFANIVHDIKISNNWTYMTEQLKYYYNLGITNPNNISNILYNQVNFADACNFNNVYITIVPKTISNNKNPTIGLSPTQKEAIIDSLRSAKVITTETIILDPVYIAIDLCVPADSSALSITESLNSSLYIVKDSNSRKDNNTIINDVNEVFLEYFDRSNSVLGQTLDINELTNKILSVDGVKTFYTKNNISGDIYNGLSFIAWNPIYKEDIQLVNKNMNFAYFKYIYLNNKTEIKNRIQIIYQESSIDNIEY